MQDPLFDPWGPEPVEPSRPTDPPKPDHASRAEEASSGADDTPRAEGKATPADPTTEARAPRWRAPAGSIPLTRPAPQPAAPAAPVPMRADHAPAADGIDERMPLVFSSPVPGRHAHDPAKSALRDTVSPRVLQFAERLRAAGHTVVVDDRTHEGTPSVRFRVRPRPGPFDGPSGLGPVLELVPDADCVGEPALLARFWPDATAERPATWISTPLGEVTGARVDDLLLEFVRRALGRH